VRRLRYKLDGVGYLDERQHIWVCDARTGATRPLTGGDRDDTDPAWSPCGRRIAFCSNRSDDPDATPWQVDVWLTGLEPGALAERVPTPAGYKGGLAWSPDGAELAYVGVESAEDPWIPKPSRVWVVPVDAGQGAGHARCLTRGLDRTVGNTTLTDTRPAFAGASAPLWSPCSGRLLFVASDPGAAHAWEVRARGGDPAPRRLTSGQVDVTELAASADRTRIAVTMATPTLPTAVFAGVLPGDGAARDTAALHLAQRSRFNAPWLARREIPAPELLEVRAADGPPLDAWLLRPPGFTPGRAWPLVLYIHGGPHHQYGHSFFHELQWLAAEGYLVLYPNPRGSTGRGEAFASAIRGDWGALDMADILACVDAVCARGVVDTARMAISGGSYGGWMTAWIIGHDHRFRCAVVDRCVSNLVSMHGTCDFVLRPDGYWPGSPWGDPGKLLQQSPLTYAGNVRTPALIIHSEGDLRCPMGQAEELFSALRRQGKEAVLVRYPASTSHGLSRTGPPDLRLDRLRRIGRWLRRWLDASADA
jgi:dipeptidyl aminopeptidase/acylaminoacyl peptidase